MLHDSFQRPAFSSRFAEIPDKSQHLEVEKHGVSGFLTGEDD